MKSKDGEKEADSGCDANSNEDGVNAVECRNGPQHETFAECKHKEQDQVQRRLPSGTLKAGQGYQEDNCQSNRNVVEPVVLTDKPITSFM